MRSMMWNKVDESVLQGEGQIDQSDKIVSQAKGGINSLGKEQLPGQECGCTNSGDGGAGDWSAVCDCVVGKSGGDDFQGEKRDNDCCDDLNGLYRIERKETNETRECLANRTKNVRALTDWPESKKNHQHLKNLDKSDEMFAIFNNLPRTVGLNLLSLKQVLEPNSSQSNSSIPVKQENISESDTTKTLLTAVEERTQKTPKTPSIRTESKDKNIFYIFRFLIPLIVLILMLIYVFGLAWYYRRQIISTIDSAEKKSQGSMASRISDDDNLRMRYKVMEAKDESLRTMGANKDSTVSQAFPLSRIQ
ncbi:hypothetical protein Bpfe_005499 [Biomphalaria pfeifferi]|uniref:Uncharacterized protein n=1 Tax=Biomphalaria pfeifferi TaxID=112525 RepID=A0AAD8FIR8_BIOPF|nr:hypothetical protein Bpfe_005499 [Biomphalaria pfeifferi]